MLLLHFPFLLTGIWHRRCWHFDLVFSHKMGINILGWTDMEQTPSLGILCVVIMLILSKVKIFLVLEWLNFAHSH